ncbi:MAG TPA: hypothetical protein VF688_10845 [Allosphingosinicella sp.]
MHQEEGRNGQQGDESGRAADRLNDATAQATDHSRGELRPRFGRHTRNLHGVDGVQELGAEALVLPLAPGPQAPP